MFSLKLVIIVLYQRMAPLHYSKIKITSNFLKKKRSWEDRVLPPLNNISSEKNKPICVLGKASCALTLPYINGRQATLVIKGGQAVTTALFSFSGILLEW